MKKNVICRIANRGDDRDPMSSDSKNSEFDRFYRENRDDLYAYLVRSLRSSTIASDILQDCFLNFYRIFKDKPWPEGEGARMYLFRIGRNLMINHSREAYQRRVSVGVDLTRSDHQESVGNVSSSHQSNLERDYENQELENLLQEALEGLKEEEKTALLLRTYQEMRLEDIAGVLDTSVATASRLIKKATRKLKEKALEMGFEED